MMGGGGGYGQPGEFFSRGTVKEEKRGTEQTGVFLCQPKKRKRSDLRSNEKGAYIADAFSPFFCSASHQSRPWSFSVSCPFLGIFQATEAVTAAAMAAA